MLDGLVSLRSGLLKYFNIVLAVMTFRQGGLFQKKGFSLTRKVTGNLIDEKKRYIRFTL